MYDSIRAFSPMPWPALVLGETGSGKEGVARALHQLSPRAAKPFVAVNCGAIPETLAESTLFGHERGAFTGADRAQAGVVERVGEGTLFLDEIGELSPPIQVKLLRLLQEGTYERLGGRRTETFSGRILAATHRELDSAQTRGNFREDLYYRLAACVIHVPPLRERLSDVPLLARHLLRRSLDELPDRVRLELSEAALRGLSQRSWPGNVRELENALRGGIARAMAGGSRILDAEHLGPVPSGSGPSAIVMGGLNKATEAFQRQRIEAALEATGGNRTQAAKQLGVSRQWLHRLMSRWDVK
jgi:DNA-binding NtrC family response regulator